MIELHIIYPLPSLLGFPSPDTIVLQHNFYEGITVESILEELALKYPGFKKILHGDNPAEIVSRAGISVNGNLLTSKKERKEPLKDGSKIMLTLPYAGG
jgi:molybdopterin converting factor small subunit